MKAPDNTVSRKAVMLAAADLIEQEGRYDFNICDIPSRCGDVGCVLGWLAYCAGIFEGDARGSALTLAAIYCGYDGDAEFYEAMDCGCGGSTDWLDDAGLAACGLRALAEEAT